MGILKIIKYFLAFWLSFVAGAIIGVILLNILTDITSINFHEDIMVFGFIALVIFGTFRKMIQKDKEKSLKMSKEDAKLSEESPSFHSVYALYTYKRKLEQLARQVKRASMQKKVRDVSRLLGMIGREVEENPKDRSKVRSLSDHTGKMIVELVEKYIKLETHNHEGSNIISTMDEIEEALNSTEKSLKDLLEELLANDVVEVSSTISVLEKILSSEDSSNRIRMEEIKKAEEDDKK